MLILLLARLEETGAEQRIRQAQYCEAFERRAQHREVERVQPESHLSSPEEAANRQAEIDRELVNPEAVKRNKK